MKKAQAKIPVVPASATEIRRALGITASEKKVAAKAVHLASARKPAASTVKPRRASARKGRASGAGDVAGR